MKKKYEMPTLLSFNMEEALMDAVSIKGNTYELSGNLSRGDNYFGDEDEE